jgi:putative oxidoreductase
MSADARHPEPSAAPPPAPGAPGWGLAGRYAPLLGRILLAHIFLVSGAAKVFDWSGTEAQMAAKGIPLVPLLHVGALLCELGGGLALLAGYRARWAALALFLFLIPTTVLFHNFWAATPAEQIHQLDNFMKNLAIMGGLALVMAFGPGPISVDRGGPWATAGGR